MLIGKVMGHIMKHFRRYWYLLTTIALTIYIFCNWSNAIDFTFFSNFDGTNLLFIAWIALIMLPCIGEFSGFGINVKSPFSDTLEKKADALIITSQNNKVTSTDDLIKNLDAVTKKVTGDNDV